MCDCGDSMKCSFQTAKIFRKSRSGSLPRPQGACVGLIRTEFHLRSGNPAVAGSDSTSLQKKWSLKPLADSAHCRIGRPADKVVRIPRDVRPRDTGIRKTMEQTTGNLGKNSGGVAGVSSFIFVLTSSSSLALNCRRCGSTAADGCRRPASTRDRYACRSSAETQCDDRLAPRWGNHCRLRHA